MNKNKWLIVAAVILALIAGVVVYITVIQNEVRSSIVMSEYKNSSRDGCDGFELQNGDKVDTFCFWTEPNEQTKYEGPIEVGDAVEYGIESGRQFIRLNK